MKVYKVEVLVIDFEQYGKDQIELIIENVCGLFCTVQDIKEADIGEWTDDHPLNNRRTAGEEIKRLFEEK